jgi:uncharacterized membrane protein
MVKRAHQNKLSNNKNGVMLEQNTVYDDSLLPSADELAKLSSISEDIVPWVMKRAEVEQDARINFNKEKTILIKSDMAHTHIYNFFALIMAFIITLFLLLASCYFIVKGYSVAGTVFAGGTIALIIFYFLNSPKNKSREEK